MAVRMRREFTIPYLPRPQFAPLHARDERWRIVLSHRRAGKTHASMNELLRRAFTCARPDGLFAYIAPQLVQAKDIAWNVLQYYSQSLHPIRRVSQDELWIEFAHNRARIRIYGAGNYNRLRGLGLEGVVLDEFGDMEPQAWSEVIRPALSDREGWGLFMGTPKGRNAFHRLWTEAEHDPDWFRLMLKASETKLLSQKELADARKFLTDDEYAQEYECSFDAAIRGAYWGKEIAALEAEGRVGNVPWEPALPVHTAWDLGMADSTVIWFIQDHAASGEVRVIDVLKGEGKGLDWYAKRLQERPYVWGNHYLPHDVKVRELGTGHSRVEVLEGYGFKPTVCRYLPVEDGIQAVRLLLPKCWFDRAKCGDGLEALKMYRRDFDERRGEYDPRPRHDWTSHYADAFRYFATEHDPRGAAARAAFRRGPRKPDTGWVV